MSLQRKITLILAAATVALVAVLYGVSSRIVLSRFAALEAEDVSQDAQRAISALEGDLTGLSSKVTD